MGRGEREQGVIAIPQGLLFGARPIRGSGPKGIHEATRPLSLVNYLHCVNNMFVDLKMSRPLLKGDEAKVAVSEDGKVSRTALLLRGSTKALSVTVGRDSREEEVKSFVELELFGGQVLWDDDDFRSPHNCPSLRAEYLPKSARGVVEEIAKPLAEIGVHSIRYWVKSIEEIGWISNAKLLGFNNFEKPLQSPSDPSPDSEKETFLKMIDFGAEKGMITQKQQEALASVVQAISFGGHLLAVLDSYPVAQKLIAEVASPWGLQVEKTISPEGDLDKL